MDTAGSSLRIGTRRSIAKFATPALILVAVILNVLAVIFAISWSQTPFLGLLMHPRLVVSDVYNPQWPARLNGVESGDRLLVINNSPVSSGRAVSPALRQYQVGSQASTTFETTTAAQEDRLLPLTDFSIQDQLVYFWIPYVIGVVYLIMGMFVYRLRGTAHAGDIFVAFSVFVSILVGGLFDQYTLHLLTPIWAFVLPLTGAALIHLALVFPARIKLVRRRPWLRTGPYGLAILLGVFSLYGLYISPDPRAYLSVWSWASAFLGISVPLFLGILLYTLYSAVSPSVRRQTMIVFWGAIIAFGPAIIWTFVSILGVATPVGGVIVVAVFIPLAVFPISMTYAMLRYRLLDLDLVFNRSVMYTVLTLMVTVVYFLVVSVLSLLLQDTFLFRSPIVLALFVFILVVSIDPLKGYLQRFVDRIFLRETLDYQQTLQRYGRALISTPLKTQKIIEMLATQAEEALQPEVIVVFLRNPDQGVFSVRHPQSQGGMQHVEVRFGLSDDLATWLADTNNILQLSPTGAAPPQVRIAQEELARLKMLNIVLIVPLLGADQLLGWLSLGLKKSGQPYSSQDLTFLATLASQSTIALENAQLLEEANRRAAELETLQKISIDIQAQTTAEAVLAKVVEQATLLLRAEGGLAFLLEPDAKTLKVVVSHNLGYDYGGVTIPASADVAGRVITLGEPVVVDHYQGFSSRTDVFKEAGFGGVLGVPLRWAGQVSGVLYLIHRPHGLRFGESDVWLMELFATQAGIALEQSRLLQEAQHSANQLATLSEVSMAISSTLDLDTALQRVMDRAVEILNAEAGSLLLMDQEGKELTFEVVLGPTGEELLGVKTPSGKGIVGAVALSGEPLIINDVSKDPRWIVDFDEATDFTTKDILCVPMIAHDRVVGVIEVINKQDGSVFDQDECNLLMSFAAQAAIAIENAQVFTRTDLLLAERVQELQTLQMFDQELQTSLELRRVLDVTLTHTMDALGLSMGLMGVIKADQSSEKGLYLLAQRGMPTEMGRYRIDPWPLTRGIMGRVSRTGVAELVNDITVAKEYVPNTHRTRSLMVVPIKREDKVIGILNLESTDSEFFTEDDLSFITILVNQAAIAIDNARLFDQVTAANEAKSEYMRTASHELKTPMTSIKGYSKLLQMGAAGALNEKQQEFLAIIVSNVDRMDRLVSDLRDASRFDAKRIRLEIEDVQIRDVINDVLRSVQTQLETKQLNLELNVPDDLPGIPADYGRMVQLVTNLISNAYKYTPEGGDITVSAGFVNGDKDGVSVTVADTGYGISEADQAKLFTQFFRSSDENIRNESGTGLGLYITRGIVECHGGELTFSSELGKGTSFTVTMPLESSIPPGVEVIRK